MKPKTVTSLKHNNSFTFACRLSMLNSNDTCYIMYEDVYEIFRTDRLERELQMVQLSATWCSFIAILWVSLMSFASVTLCVASQQVFIVAVFLFLYRLSPETFWYHKIFRRFLNGTVSTTDVIYLWISWRYNYARWTRKECRGSGRGLF
jgi:hypothetical protein